MTDKRKFTQRLGNSMDRSHIKEAPSIVREKNNLNITQLVEPVQFEQFVTKNKLLLMNDPNREMVIFPTDDVKMVKVARPLRTENASVPPDSKTVYADNLLAQQCIDFFTSSWTTVEYKSSQYSGSFQQLPKKKETDVKGSLPIQQKFEIDVQADSEDSSKCSGQRSKGPFHEARLTVCSREDHSRYLQRKEEQLRGKNGTSDQSNSSSGVVGAGVPVLKNYCFKQLLDHTHVLEEIRKDGQRNTVYLDSAQSVREIGESWLLLEMVDQPEVYLYTGNKESNKRWLGVLRDALASQLSLKTGSNHSHSNSSDNSDVGADSIRGSLQKGRVSPVSTSIENLLGKYSQETETTLSHWRAKDHQKLLSVYQEIRVPFDQSNSKSGEHGVDSELGDEAGVHPFPDRPELFKRFRLSCLRFQTGLQAPVSEGTTKMDNPEPFFVSLCLIHVGEGRRLSEDFHWDPNSKAVSAMLPPDLFRSRWMSRASHEENSSSGEVVTPQGLHTVAEDTLARCKTCLVSTAYPEDQVYILVRVEKVLQGAVSMPAEKYIKSGGSLGAVGESNGGTVTTTLSGGEVKTGAQINKTMAVYCSNIGHYRMPFAWGARPLSSRGTDIRLFKHENNKLSEEDMIKHVQGLARSDRAVRWQTIPAILQVQVEPLTDPKPSDNFLTPSLIPIQPFPPWPVCVERELEHFHEDGRLTLSSGHDSEASSSAGTGGGASGTLPNGVGWGRDAAGTPLPEALVLPHLSFYNTLYVYPKSLNFSGQHGFSRARTLSCFVELRDNDNVDLTTPNKEDVLFVNDPLNVFYTRPSSLQGVFDCWSNTAVTYHDASPNFSDEIKICLPARLHSKHHLLFRFYHVSVETAGTPNAREKAGGKRPLESGVGFAWVTLLNKEDNLLTGSFNTRVSVNLPAGYLDLKQKDVSSNSLKRRSGNSSKSSRISGGGVHDTPTSSDSQTVWVDGQKNLFSVDLRLRSSVYTTDPFLHRFFRTCNYRLSKMLLQQSNSTTANAGTTSAAGNGPESPPHEAPPSLPTDMESSVVIRNVGPLGDYHAGDKEVQNVLKSLAALDLCSIIQFMPPLFNQLLQIVASVTSCPEVPSLAVSTLAILVSRITGKGPDKITRISEEIRTRNTKLLKSYVKYAFDADRVTVYRSQSVHQTLVTHIIAVMKMSTTDSLGCYRLVSNNWFFLSVIAKSMVNYLCTTNKIKAERSFESRFPEKFQTELADLCSILGDWIVDMSQLKNNKCEMYEDAKAANVQLARFTSRLFNFMDRGFVFNLVHSYMGKIEAKELELGDDRDRLFLMKCQFVQQICNHEHFVALNLPSLSRNYNKEVGSEIFLTKEFCEHHYLVGLLLQLVHKQLSDTAPSSSSFIRRQPMIILRSQLAKHSFDDRYSSRPIQARIGTLYLPLLNILLEHKSQFCAPGTGYTSTNPNTQHHEPASLSLSVGGSTRPHSLISADTTSLISSSSSLSNPPSLPLGGGSVFGAASTSSSSRSYLNREGKVELSVLDAIAGVSSGGSLLRIQSQSRRSRDCDQLSLGSTSTLTAGGSLCGAEDDLMEEDEHTPEGEKSLPKIDDPETPTPLNPTASVTRRRAPRPPIGSIKFFGSGSLQEDTGSCDLMPSEDGHRSLPRRHGWRLTQDLKQRRRSIASRPQHLNDKCQRDLLTCLLHVISSVSQDKLSTLLKNITLQDRIELLDLLLLSILHNKYLGQKKIVDFESISTGSVSRQTNLRSQVRNSTFSSSTEDNGSLYQNDDTDGGNYRSLLEGNLATETGLIILDVICQFCSIFKNELESATVDHALFKKLVEVYLTFLRTPQSETLLKHLFSSLRVFVTRFSKLLFSHCSNVVGDLCLEALNCLNRKLHSTRSEACGLLYILMRASFEAYSKTGINRVHQQIIISVSKLAGSIESGFELSLSQLNSLAQTDVTRSTLRSTGKTGRVFAEEVAELARCIRTVLMANAQMREHENDPEMLVDLQHSLARSYASNPALRRTWLESILKVHQEHKATTEVAMVRVHIAALIAEYLKRKGNLESQYPQGAAAFISISPNIEVEEKNARGDSGQMEVDYTEEDLQEEMRQAAQAIDNAGLYEVLVHIYRLLIPVREKSRDLAGLAEIYRHLADGYKRARQEEDSGHRLFGEYYRVCFYGQHFETLAGKTFVYKTDRCMELSSMCQRMMAIFSGKYGADNVSLLTEAHVTRSELDQKRAFIQVTHVQPYFEKEEALDRQTRFENNFNIHRFMFETPFLKQPNLDNDACLVTPGPKRSDDLSAQWKRRTILTTEQSFPNLKRRLEVRSLAEVDLSPIEGAVDAIKAKTLQLSGHLGLRSFSKLMDMHLQGALLTTVNQGPMAYAETFLKLENQSAYPKEKVDLLKKLFLEFLSTCLQLLHQYEELMSKELIEKYQAMKKAFDAYRVELSNLVKEEILVDEVKLTLSTKSAMVLNSKPNHDSSA